MKSYTTWLDYSRAWDIPDKCPMSPHLQALQGVISDISVGFEALGELLDAHREVQHDLRRHLAKAIDRLNSNNGENPSDGVLPEWQDGFVNQLSCSRAKSHALDSGSAPEILKAEYAIKKLKSDMAGSTARKCPAAQKLPPTDGGTVATPVQLNCPVAHDQPPTYEEMEKDFTTQGKPSSLECPFAKMAQGGPLDLASQIDPIAAEFHAASLSAQSLDASRACGRCPIRFLDKHSPEEIAQYFENHKHELPRSHEICVKRYQQNENSIRQLDAKYGNLVSMIQGLGDKHKRYLPSEERAAPSRSEQKSTAAVETWAKTVGSDMNMAEAETEPERRVSHFDKPLRDVRVGESPTRPWGIHVPADRPKAPSAASSDRASAPPSVKLESPTRQSKPVLDAVTPEAASTQVTASNAASKRSRRRRPNQIIFNGPVFLGYSPEQAAQFLNQIGGGRAI